LASECDSNWILRLALASLASQCPTISLEIFLDRRPVPSHLPLLLFGSIGEIFDLCCTEVEDKGSEFEKLVKGKSRKFRELVGGRFGSEEGRANEVKASQGR
jgi:hypothetical protein